MKRPLLIWLIFLTIVVSSVAYMVYHIPSVRILIVATFLFIPLFTVAKILSAPKPTPQEIHHVEYKTPKPQKETIKPVFQRSKTPRILR